MSRALRDVRALFARVRTHRTLRGLRRQSLLLPAGALALGALAFACAEGSSTDLTEETPVVDAGPRTDARTPLPETDSGTEEPEDDGGTTDSGTDGGQTSNACTQALAAITYDFEGSDQGWASAVSDGASAPGWPLNGWSRGAATHGTACGTGQCFGAELGQNYAQCQRAHVTSPKINLSACAGKTVAVSFKHAYAFWSSGANFDGGVVLVSGDDGATWQTAQGSYPGTVAIRASYGGYSCVQPAFSVSGKSGFVGNQASTVTTELTLPAATVTANTRIRFAYGTGVSSLTDQANVSRSATGFGWRVDDVRLLAK